jgi:hypothetical protein
MFPALFSAKAFDLKIWLRGRRAPAPCPKSGIPAVFPLLNPATGIDKKKRLDSSKTMIIWQKRRAVHYGIAPPRGKNKGTPTGKESRQPPA